MAQFHREADPTLRARVEVLQVAALRVDRLRPVRKRRVMPSKRLGIDMTQAPERLPPQVTVAVSLAPFPWPAAEPSRR